MLSEFESIAASFLAKNTIETNAWGGIIIDEEKHKAIS